LFPVSFIFALFLWIDISCIVVCQGTMQKYNLQEQCKNTNYREQYKVLITGENTRIQHTWNNIKYTSYMEQYTWYKVVWLLFLLLFFVTGIFCIIPCSLWSVLLVISLSVSCDLYLFLCSL
jgi:hypothetical protein